MVDREKYIDILKQIVKTKKKYYKNDEIPIRISYQCVVDILALLKEQPDVVRCKDCKHRPTQTEPEKEGYTLEFPDYICPCQCDDGWYSWYPKDNWFCANGERTETYRKLAET